MLHCNSLFVARRRSALAVALLVIGLIASLRSEEPDLTVSKDYGISRRMTTELVDDALLKNLRESDYAKRTLNDPVLQSAYIRVFLNVMDVTTGEGLRPELAAALNDLKRRGNTVAPVLLKLMKENPYSPFEDAALAAIYIDTIDPKPFIEYARDALKTRWETLPPGTVGRIAYLLIHKGVPSDLDLLREVVKKRPYLTDPIESEITAAKRPGGPLADAQTTSVKDRNGAADAGVKTSHGLQPKIMPNASETGSKLWLVWLFVVIAATVGATWLLLRKRK